MLVFSVSCGEDDPPEVQTAGQAVESSQASNSEILERVGQITAWTDAGLFVYGGVDETRESVGGAALINPDTGALTSLPEPFDFPIRRVGVAAPTVSGVFLLGQLCETTVYEEESAYCEPGGLAAGILSLSDQTWNPVDIPEELHAGSRADWVTQLFGVTPSGTLVLEVATAGSRQIGDAPYWTFDPVTVEWVHLPDPGVVIDDACLAGEHLVVSASEVAEDGGTHGNVTLNILRADQPGAEWSALTTLSEIAWGSYPLVSCGGTFAVVYGFTLDSPADVAFSQSVEPPGEWEDLSPFPDFVVDHEVWTGDQLVLFDETGAALIFDGDTWTPLDLPRGPIGSDPVWTGEEFVVIDPTSDTGTSVGAVEG